MSGVYVSLNVRANLVNRIQSRFLTEGKKLSCRRNAHSSFLLSNNVCLVVFWVPSKYSYILTTCFCAFEH